MPADEVRNEQFDCLLFQTRTNYEIDQFAILSSEQQKLPKIYLEHDPPQSHPTNTLHWAADPNVLLVHVTPFNALMWDSGSAQDASDRSWRHCARRRADTGEIERGIVVINHLRSRGRRLGSDVFEQLREHVPLDLVGMAAEEMRGLGEVHPLELTAFAARYRFFFNPIRYTSLGLAVIEAMLIGMPIVGLATTEMVTAIENGVSGFVETDPQKLVPHMRQLLANPQEARRLGEGARRYARERFNIQRFVRDWEQAFAEVTSIGEGRVRQHI